jgi:quinol monooxygenase YgiN
MKAGQVWELAQLSLKTESVAGFPAAAHEALEVLRSADGCDAAYLLSGIEEPTRPVLLIQWADVPTHLAFRESDAFLDFRRPIQDSFAELPVFAHHRIEEA